MSALTRPAMAGLLIATAIAFAPGVAWAVDVGDPGRAARSLTSTFGELARAPQAPGVAAGQTVDEYVGRDIARVVDSRGRRSVVLSSLPLRSRTGSGAMRPLSLNLQGAAPGELRPQNPVAQVRIATDPRKGFTIGPDAGHLVTIVPVGIRADAPDATVFVGQALFAGARTAGDLLIRPSATGVQTFEQLTAPAAPEAFSYRLELGRDQTAELAGDIVTIKQAGEVIVRSLPPIAIDADRRSVPVAISLDGDTVRLDVAHRGHGFRYPIAVDPDWTSSYDYDSHPGLGLQGWHVGGEAPEYYDAFINNVYDPVNDPDGNALGFFIRPRVTGASRIFPTGVGATLFFNAPGTTNIRSVTYDDVHRFNDRDRQTLRLALYGPSFKESDDVFEAEILSEAPVTLPRDPFPDDQDTPAKTAVMWMYSSPCVAGEDLNCPPVIDSTTRTLLKVGSVQLVLTDFDFPATQAPGTLRDLQDRWTDATDSRTLDPSAIDEGSGVRDLTVSVEDANGTHPVRSIQSPCHPDHDQVDPPQDNAICPRVLTLDQPLSIDASRLMEGRSTFTIDASDLADNTAADGGTSTTFSLYLDRFKPTTAAAGELHDAATWIRPRRPSTVTVTGTDIAGGEGRTSGIAHNHLSAVDAHGNSVLDRDADTCTPPGPIATPCDPGKASSFTVDPRTFLEGTLAFTATSTDLAGNISDPVTWTVRIDRTPPAARATGDLVSLTSQHTNSTATTSVTLHGRDAASGVARLQLLASNSDGETILADRDTCTAEDIDPIDGSCPHSPTVQVSVDPADLPDGPTTFIARAIDHAGIPSVDNQDWDTYVDHTPPDPPDSVTVTQTSNSSVQITWPTVTDQPLGSGDVSYEYLITAGGQPIGGWRPTDNPYAQVTGLPPGTTISVLVRAIDAARNFGAPAEGGVTLRQVGVGGGGCALPSGTIGQLPWLPIDGIWSPGGQITTSATIGCTTAIAITPPAGNNISASFPEFRGRTCLERNAGNGWRSFGLCTPFNRPNLKVQSKVLGAVKIFEVSTLIADIGHCTLRVQGSASFRVRVHLHVRLEVTGASTPGDKSADPTFVTRVQRQHCQTELDGWKRLARTNPRRPIIPLASRPEAILRRALGSRGKRDTRPVASNGSRAGWDAHHIIPASAGKANSAQISGFRCHVHPNSRLNGIWLRGPTLDASKPGYAALTDDGKKRVLHSRTSTTDYYQRINRLMATPRRGAFGCDQGKAERLLGDIDHQLANGDVRIHDSAAGP